jgi:hypothetical protein
MEPPDAMLKWQLRFDNPNFIGWSVVAAYIGAAVCCGRAAMDCRAAPTRAVAPLWWLLAAGLIFLGINKQLNLQTLMIVIGRNLSRAGHWYVARRRLQLIFSVVFAALCLGTLAWFSWRWRPFFRQHRLVLAGLIVLALFVVVRASTINHADAFLGINLKDKDWTWVLEIGGSALIGMGALTGRRSSEP